jgi:Cu(I)/Ag(I) efflux system protein CusF
MNPMKANARLLVGLVAMGLVAACSAAPSGDAAVPATAPTRAAMADAGKPAPTQQASATGTIEAIDMVAKTVTIAHGPVPALQWPAMTMTFQAPGIDLAAFKPGDRIAFEFSAQGMKATVIALKRE